MKFNLGLLIILTLVSVAFAARNPPRFMRDSEGSPSWLCQGDSNDWYRTYGLGGNQFTGFAKYTGTVGDDVTTLTGNWFENGIHTDESTGPETLTFEYIIDDSEDYPTAYLQANWTWAYSSDTTDEYHYQLTPEQFVDEALAQQYCLVPANPTATDGLLGRWFGGSALVGNGDFYVCRSTIDGTTDTIYGTGHGLYEWYFEAQTWDNGLTASGDFYYTTEDGKSKKGDIVLRAVADDQIEGWVVLGNSYKFRPSYWASFTRVNGDPQNPLECSIAEDQKDYAKDSTSGRGNNRHRHRKTDFGRDSYDE